MKSIGLSESSSAVAWSVTWLFAGASSLRKTLTVMVSPGRSVSPGPVGERTSRSSVVPGKGALDESPIRPVPLVSRWRIGGSVSTFPVLWMTIWPSKTEFGRVLAGIETFTETCGELPATTCSGAGKVTTSLPASLAVRV